MLMMGGASLLMVHKAPVLVLGVDFSQGVAFVLGVVFVLEEGVFEELEFVQYRTVDNRTHTMREGVSVMQQ